MWLHRRFVQGFGWNIHLFKLVGERSVISVKENTGKIDRSVAVEKLNENFPHLSCVSVRERERKREHWLCERAFEQSAFSKPAVRTRW